jgi:hypothetical protein
MEYKERMLKDPALTLLRARPKDKNYFALTVTCGSSLSCLISRRILEQQFAMLIPGEEAHIEYQNHGDSWSVPIERVVGAARSLAVTPAITWVSRQDAPASWPSGVSRQGRYLGAPG